MPAVRWLVPVASDGVNTPSKNTSVVLADGAAFPDLFDLGPETAWTPEGLSVLAPVIREARLRVEANAQLDPAATDGALRATAVAFARPGAPTIRLELPRGGEYLGIEIERCDGSEPKLTTVNVDGSKHVAENSWPTGAPVQH